MIDKHFKYEEKIIDPLLTIIKDNQEYLTQIENLPQLAKLGFMYNKLWYSGRVAWGNEGILREGAVKILTAEEMVEIGADEEESNYYDCEDNPKYKIEMCDPINEEIENLIYDAWGMHVEYSEPLMNWESFYKIIKEGRELSNLDRKSLKINKTFDEWVELLTDKGYRYSSIYPNRRSVADHLLCVIGNGYGVNKDGFVIAEAGGADQDEAIYGDWENCVFREDIQKFVDSILEIPEVKATINCEYERRLEYVNEQKKKDREQNKFYYKFLKEAGLYSDEEGDLDLSEIFSRIRKIDTSGVDDEEDEVLFLPNDKKYRPYYPISSSSLIFKMFDEETQKREKIGKFHESYIQEGIRICQEILEHEKEETEGSNRNGSNVIFAKKFLSKNGFPEYASQLEKEVDKYELEKQILELLIPITNNFKKSKDNKIKEGEYYFYFNNTAKNSYADNSYSIIASIPTEKIPKGFYNSVEILKDFDFYADLKSNLEKISKLEGIKLIEFYVNNGFDKKEAQIYICFSPKGSNDQLEFEELLSNTGFEVGSSNVYYRLNDLIFYSSKPKILGKTHPHTKIGDECFSTNHSFDVLNNNGKKLCSFRIDERHVNIISTSNKSEIAKWIIEEHKNMKDSNPEYGTWHWDSNNKQAGSEGTRCITAHAFFQWLKENPIK